MKKITDDENYCKTKKENKKFKIYSTRKNLIDFSLISLSAQQISTSFCASFRYVFIFIQI